MEARLGHNSLSLRRLRSTALLNPPCTLGLPLQPQYRLISSLSLVQNRPWLLKENNFLGDVAEQRLASAPEEGLLGAQDLHGARRVLGQVGQRACACPMTPL